MNLRIGELDKKQIIFETETLSAVVAFALWKDNVANSRCLSFADNETKKTLSKGFSKNSVVDLLSGYFAEFETAVHSLTWIARMPSKSNVADSPPRNDTSSSFFNNAIDVSEPAKGIMVALLEKLERDGVRGFETSHPGKRQKQS